MSEKQITICNTASDLFQNAKYTQNIERLCANDIPYMDLVGMKYAVSSDTGSGSFPKWFPDGHIIKINNNFRSSEPNGTDGINECFIFDLCKQTGISIAPAYPVRVKYRLQEWRRDIETFGMINERFQVRKIDAVRLSENAPQGNINFYLNIDTVGFIRMLFLDYVTGQVDRHQKNFAYVVNEQNVRMHPLYDNGLCLGYDGQLVMDDRPFPALRNAELSQTEVLDLALKYGNLSLTDIIDVLKFKDNVIQQCARYRSIYENRTDDMQSYILLRLAFIEQNFI